MTVARFERALLQHLAEALLDAGALRLDVVVVDRTDLDDAERRISLRAGDVDARGVEMLEREQLLHRSAEHEIREGLGGVRVGRTLHDRARRGNDEGAV